MGPQQLKYLSQGKSDLNSKQNLGHHQRKCDGIESKDRYLRFSWQFCKNCVETAVFITQLSSLGVSVEANEDEKIATHKGQRQKRYLQKKWAFWLDSLHWGVREEFALCLFSSFHFYCYVASLINHSKLAIHDWYHAVSSMTLYSYFYGSIYMVGCFAPTCSLISLIPIHDCFVGMTWISGQKHTLLPEDWSHSFSGYVSNQMFWIFIVKTDKYTWKVSD